MTKKLIRLIGILFIIGFAAFNILLLQFERELIPTQGKTSSSAIQSIVATLLPYITFVENYFYDIRMKKTLPKVLTQNRQVLAAIDDKALNKIGRWPWSRSVWVQVIEKLKLYGAKVVAFDVVFAEPEKSCDPLNSPDKLLSNAIKDFTSVSNPGQQNIIISYSVAPPPWNEQEHLKDIPEYLYSYTLTAQTGKQSLSLYRVEKNNFPLTELLDAGAELAFIGAREDVDGIFRHYPLLTNVPENDGLSSYFPSFSLQAYRDLTGDNPVLHVNENDAYIELKTGRAYLNFEGEVKVRWSGEDEVFPSISIANIMNASPDDKEIRRLIKGKIIYIGSTAFAAHDLRHTPIDPKMPGVYFHMNVTQMLLQGKFFRPLDQSITWSWGLMLGGVALLILASLLGQAILDVLIMASFAIGMYFVDTYYFIPQGYQITLFFILFAVVGTYFWNTLISFYLANKDKKFLKHAFGNYISPMLIEEMRRRGEPPKLGGEVGPLTAYFTDIQGFSTFSEKLSAPKLVELLNEYLTAMTDILLTHDGTLDKYEGDAIIAFFGAPLPLPDHALKACRVALQMQATLSDLRAKWAREGERWPVFVHNMRMRIGINSGEIVTGNMGSRSRMNYTMMGDSVNLASRLETAAKQYGIFIHLSQFTKQLLGDQFELRELDTIRVVGKSEPVTTYDLLGEKGKTSEFLLQLKNNFSSGIALYKQQQWDRAIEIFSTTLDLEHQRYPELKGKINPSIVYIERCKQFKLNPPPPKWDGVCTLTSK